VTSKFKVSVLPDPEVSIPLEPPRMFQFPAVGLNAPPVSPVIVWPTVEPLTPIVTVDPEPEMEIPGPFARVKALRAGVAVPEGVGKEVGIVGCSVTSKLKVTVFPLAVVSIPLVPPASIKIFAAGVAEPESALKVVGTEGPASRFIVPGPFVIVTVAPVEESVLTRINGAEFAPIRS